MATLDNETLIQALDTENMLQSIQDLPDQVEAAWNHATAFALPTHYIQSTNVVILGIGTSALGGYLAHALAQGLGRRPVVLCQETVLPEFVDSSTLVIAISYSGRTPEVVGPFTEAGRRGAKLLGISTGGELGAVCRKYRAPHFSIQYGAQARAALGYLVIPVIAILARLNLVALDHLEGTIATLSSALRVSNDKLRPVVPTSQNQAKQLAESLQGKLPVLVGSTQSWPVVARWQMQLEQNAHVFAVTDRLPGGLYTTLDGLSFPVDVTAHLYFIHIRSAFDDEAVAAAHNLYRSSSKKRRMISDDVLIAAVSDPLTEAFELMLLGDYISYYLALLGGVDPGATPNIMEISHR